MAKTKLKKYLRQDGQNKIRRHNKKYSAFGR